MGKGYIFNPRCRSTMAGITWLLSFYMYSLVTFIWHISVIEFKVAPILLKIFWFWFYLPVLFNPPFTCNMVASWRGTLITALSQCHTTVRSVGETVFLQSSGRSISAAINAAWFYPSNPPNSTEQYMIVNTFVSMAKVFLSCIRTNPFDDWALKLL